MKTEDWTLVLGIVQTVVIILSFGALVWQLFQVNRNLKQDAYSRAIEDHSQMVNRLLEKPRLNRFFYEGVKDFEILNADEKDFYNYIALSFTLFERIYLLSRRGAVEPQIWSSWEKWLVEGWFRLQLFEIFWKNEGVFFTEDFREFIQNRYEEFKSDSSAREADA